MSEATTMGGAQADTSLRAAQFEAKGNAHPLLGFAIRRIGSGFVVLFVVSILIFAATNVLPGSPSSVVLGKQATPTAVHELDHQLGLDKPLYQRYWTWLSGLIQGDLGDSAVQRAQGQKTPVSSLISAPLGHTLILAAIATVLLIPLSLLLGVWAALRVGKPADQAVSVTTLAFVSLPEFVIGSLLILLFFSALHWLPPISLLGPGQSPLSDPKLLIMPVLTLLATSLAWTTRLVRAGMVEALDSEYVAMARLNGLSPRKVRYGYALRNALAPSVQVFAQSVQVLVGGVIVTEVVFSYPGLGHVLVDAVDGRDFTVVQSVAMLIATVYLALNILADFIVVLVVPRLRTGG